MNRVSRFAQKNSTNERTVQRWEGRDPRGGRLIFDVVEIEGQGFVFRPYKPVGGGFTGVKSDMQPVMPMERCIDIAKKQTPKLCGFRQHQGFNWAVVREHN